jgi:hypothetical protein
MNMKIKKNSSYLCVVFAGNGDENYQWEVQYATGSRWVERAVFATEADMEIYRKYEKTKVRKSHKPKLPPTVPLMLTLPTPPVLTLLSPPPTTPIFLLPAPESTSATGHCVEPHRSKRNKLNI